MQVRKNRTAWIAVAAAIVITTPGRAQDRAAVGGAVTDDVGRPVAEATVSVPALERRTKTDAAGTYALRQLPATTLIVQIRAVGYEPVVRRLVLVAGRTDTLDVRLTRAAVTVAEIVVTGTATASDQLAAQDVVAVPAEQLRAVATASLGKTLEAVPGVTNISTGPASGNPVLRGLSQSRIRITRDGIGQENFQATARWFPPGNFASIERIEVIRGPASILYGSSALGGAINLLPKALPTSPDGRLRLDGLAEAQYFTNNRERYGQTELAGAIGAVGFRAGVGRRVADDFRTASAPSYTATQRRGDPLYTGDVAFSNFEQRTGYAQLGVAGGWGQVQALYDGWQGDNNFPNANGKPAGVSVLNHDLRLKSNVLVGPFVLKPSVVYQWTRILRAATTARSYEVAADSNLWDQSLVAKIWTGRVEAQHPALFGVRGTIGTEYTRQDGETRLSRIQPSGSIDNVAAFAFEEFRRDRFAISAGGRVDYRRQRAAANSLVSRLAADQQAAALDRSFTVGSASIGGAYELVGPLSVAVNLSTGFRAPSFIDLYTDENRPVLNGWQEGNPLLKPERSTSVEGSLRYDARRATARATVYRNRIDNFIYITRTAATRVVSGRTVPVFGTLQADARLSGIELSGSAEPVARVVVEASYAAVRSRNDATGERLPLMPADQLRGSVRFAVPDVGALQQPYIQVGVKHAWYQAIAGITEPFAEFDANPLGYGLSSTPAYTLVDAGAGTRLAVGASALELYLAVENLFDVAFRDFLDTQKGFTLGQGRNLTVRVAAPLVLVR